MFFVLRSERLHHRILNNPAQPLDSLMPFTGARLRRCAEIRGGNDATECAAVCDLDDSAAPRSGRDPGAFSAS